MTPSSSRPLDKVLFGAVAAAVATIALSLIRHFLWPDMPADLEGPFNTVIAALFIGGTSGFVGWLTPIKPGEITATDTRIVEDAAERAEAEI